MKLFIYDHCPYCVKARMIFGLKNIPVELITLLNDDEKTPIDMIGQKMVPILEKAPGQFMAESMDIVQFIDAKHLPALVLKKEDEALLSLLDEARTACYSLVMPRWLNSEMEEFKTSFARKYFQKKKEQMIGPFAKALKNTKIFKKEVENLLLKIEDRFLQKNLAYQPIKNKTSAISRLWYLGDKISFNDFHLFAFLRSLSIVKDLCFPPALAGYMKHCSEKTRIPLNTAL